MSKIGKYPIFYCKYKSIDELDQLGLVDVIVALIRSRYSV